MRKSFGVLRVVRVRPPSGAAAKRQSSEWLPHDRPVHVLTNRVTTIGRALSNDILLMDPTVSREHARLVVTEEGWRVYNLTENSIVRVNGKAVPFGQSMPLVSQDYLVLGSTLLQLVAPENSGIEESGPGPLVADGHSRLIEEEEQVLLEDQALALKQQRKEQVSPGSITPAPDISWCPEPTPKAIPDTLDLCRGGESEERQETWNVQNEELFGVGVTLEFALPRRFGLRKRWLLWLFAALGIIVLIVALMLNSFISLGSVRQDGLPNLLMAVLIPLIPAGLIVLLVNFIDSYEREPWFLKLAAFLWGAAIAVPLSVWIEEGVDRLIQAAGFKLETNTFWIVLLQGGLNPGITEEVMKGLGLLLFFLFLRDEFDNVTDGIVYGALIGAGLAMVENTRYFIDNSSTSLLANLIVGRIVLGWLTHPTFTICFGAALGYVRHTRVRWKQILIPLVGLLIAIFLHTIFDSVNYYAYEILFPTPENNRTMFFWWLAISCNYVLPLLAQISLVYVLLRALTHESAIIREFLADEVSSGTVTVEEYALLQSASQRRRVEKKVRQTQGFKQWLRVQALYQTEIGLAFRKWHVSTGDKPKRREIQPEEAYRQRIWRLRQEIEAAQLEASKDHQ